MIVTHLMLCRESFKVTDNLFSGLPDRFKVSLLQSSGLVYPATLFASPCDPVVCVCVLVGF